jgi:hypothetical protein
MKSSRFNYKSVTFGYELIISRYLMMPYLISLLDLSNILISSNCCISSALSEFFYIVSRFSLNFCILFAINLTLRVVLLNLPLNNDSLSALLIVDSLSFCLRIYDFYLIALDSLVASNSLDYYLELSSLAPNERLKLLFFVN